MNIFDGFWKNLALLILLLFAGTVHSETFAKSLANIGSLEQTIRTKDGGYVLVINDRKDKKIVIRKINPDGTKVWQKQLASPQGDILAGGIGLAINGGIFVTVSHADHRSRSSRIAILRFDKDGRIQWNKGFQHIVTLAWWFASFDSIIGTADGGALAAGSGCAVACDFLEGLADRRVALLNCF